MQSSPHQVDSSSGQVFVVIKREARKYIVHTGVKGARADVRSLERGLSAKEIDVELDQRDSLESGIDDLLVSSRVLFNNGDGSLESKQDNKPQCFPCILTCSVSGLWVAMRSGLVHASEE